MGENMEKQQLIYKRDSLKYLRKRYFNRISTLNIEIAELDLQITPVVKRTKLESFLSFFGGK